MSFRQDSGIYFSSFLSWRVYLKVIYLSSPQYWMTFWKSKSSFYHIWQQTAFLLFYFLIQGRCQLLWGYFCKDFLKGLFLLLVMSDNEFNRDYKILVLGYVILRKKLLFSIDHTTEDFSLSFSLFYTICIHSLFLPNSFFLHSNYFFKLFSKVFYSWVWEYFSLLLFILFEDFPILPWSICFQFLTMLSIFLRAFLLISLFRLFPFRLYFWNSS